MAFNGSGTFSRLYSWVTDAANGILIRSDRMDADSNDIASGLTNVICKDGQSTTTAIIPFSQGIKTSDGTVSAPSVTYTSETSSGLYRSSTGVLGIAAAGVNSAFFTSTGYTAGTHYTFAGGSPVYMAGTINNYYQLSVQNKSSGTTASSDFVATADTGTDTTNYVNLGINGSGFSGTLFNNALDGYLFSQSSNLVVGTVGVKDLIFAANNTEVARLNSSGNLLVNTNKFVVTGASGNISAAGTITGSTTQTLGTNGATGGQITLNGSTSGSAILKVSATAGSAIPFQLPTTTGTSGQALQTDGTGVTSWATITSITYGQIYNCIPISISGTNTTAAVSISSGQSANSTNSVYIISAGYSWAVSNGNAINGYQGGSTLPNSSTIHFYLCTGGSGTGSFASTSLTPTLPTGYTTAYRRIFSLNTDGSGALIPINLVETEGGSLTAYLTTQLLDVSTAVLGTSRTLYTLTVPTGIIVQPFVRFTTTAGANNAVLITSPNETDVAPTIAGGSISFGSAPGYDVAYQTNANSVSSTSAYTSGILLTNTSGQIGARASGINTSLFGVTRGFKDFRRS